MIKLFFQVSVSLLLLVLFANLVAFMMPVLTHPIATIAFLGLFVLFGVSAYKAGNDD